MRKWMGMVLVLCVGFFPLEIFATGGAGLPGRFLTWGVGGRALGMGKAYVGLVDDASSPYWNAAGLSSLEKRQVMLQYVSLFEKTHFGYLGFVQPLPKYGTVGVGWAGLFSLGFQEEDEAGEGEVTEFSDTYNAFIAAHSIKFLECLSWGYSLKLVTHKLKESAVGFGIDTGVLYKFSLGELAQLGLGMNLQNLLPPQLNVGGVTEKCPLNVNAGVGASMFENRLIIGLSAEKSQKRDVGIHFGGEFNYAFMSFRAGYDAQGPTLGLGLKWRVYQFDYACGIQAMGGSHRVSLAANF